MRAETSIDLDEEMSEKVFNIMEFMDNLDDVQEVHTNGFAGEAAHQAPPTPGPAASGQYRLDELGKYRCGDRVPESARDHKSWYCRRKGVMGCFCTDFLTTHPYQWVDTNPLRLC